MSPDLVPLKEIDPSLALSIDMFETTGKECVPCREEFSVAHVKPITSLIHLIVKGYW